MQWLITGFQFVRLCDFVMCWFFGSCQPAECPRLVTRMSEHLCHGSGSSDINSFIYKSYPPLVDGSWFTSAIHSLENKCPGKHAIRFYYNIATSDPQILNPYSTRIEGTLKGNPIRYLECLLIWSSSSRPCLLNPNSSFSEAGGQTLMNPEPIVQSQASGSNKSSGK